MGFNYAAEKKKFDAQWERNSEWYRSEGMSEESIQNIKILTGLFFAAKEFTKITHRRYLKKSMML